MDRLDHDIVQDLLPLYHDGICSEKSRAAVEEHLRTCEDCRAALAAMDAPLPEAEKAAADDAAAVKKISGAWKKGKRRAWWKGVLAAALVFTAILFAAYRTQGFADCAYPLFRYDCSWDLAAEAGDSFSKTFNTRSILHEDLNAFSVVVKEASGPCRIVVTSDGEVLHDSGAVTDEYSYQGHETLSGQDYTVTIQNLGETSLSGRVLIAAYYWLRWSS